jgi:hypothetical protein
VTGTPAIGLPVWSLTVTAGGELTALPAVAFCSGGDAAWMLVGTCGGGGSVGPLSPPQALYAMASAITIGIPRVRNGDAAIAAFNGDAAIAAFRVSSKGRRNRRTHEGHPDDQSGGPLLEAIRNVCGAR